MSGLLTKKITHSTRSGAKIVGAMLGALVLLTANSAHAQAGVSFYGQVVDQTGKPAPLAKVRICAQTGGGTPCNPLSTIYSDPALTHQIDNPVTTDSRGNYNVFVTQGYYILQFTVSGSGMYSYVASAATGGTGATFPNTVVPVTALTPITSRPAILTDYVGTTSTLWNGGGCDTSTNFLQAGGGCSASTATPGGSNQDNQINVSGAFGVDHGQYTYDTSIHTLYAQNLNNPLAVTGPNSGLPFTRLNVTGNANLGTINFMPCSSTGTSCTGQMDPYYWTTGYTQRAPAGLGQNANFGANNIVYNIYSGGANNNVDGPSMAGLFINYEPHQIQMNQFTPGQGGGTSQVNINQYAAGDSVWMGGIQRCWAANRGQDEACERWRYFLSFTNPDFGGTLMNLASATPEGHYNISITPFGGYNIVNGGEENYLIDVTRRSQLGNAKGAGYAAWDTSSNFPQIQLDAATSFAVTGHTSITAVVNGDVYTGCPSTDTGQQYPLVASPPYGSVNLGSGDAWVTLPNGTGLQGVNGNYDPSVGTLLGYCYTVTSTAPGGGMPALTSDSLVFIGGAEFNAEFTKATVIDSTHFRAFTHHNHRVGETVAWGAAIGQAVGFNLDERPPGYSSSNQNNQNTILRLVNPIVSVEDSTHITTYPIAEATAKSWITLAYNGTVPATPLTLTPTISGGALTSLSPSTPGDYGALQGAGGSLHGNPRLSPPKLELVSSSATTYVQTNFDEFGTGHPLNGTAPNVCQNGCTGTWTLTGGNDFSYRYGGGVVITQQNITPPLPKVDLIETGHANENVQAHIDTLTPFSVGSSFDQIIVRWTDINNFLMLQIGTDTFGTTLVDVVGGTGTVLASTAPGLGVVGDYTFVLNGSAVSVFTPFGTLSGTTANTTATKVGIGMENGSILAFSSFLVTSLNGTCSSNPVIKFQEVDISNVLGYQPSITSNGSGCPSDLAINLLPTQNRVYSVPVAIINKMVDPANLPTATNPIVFPDGNIQLQALNSSLWTNGDEVQETMLPGRYITGNIAETGDPIVSNSPRTGTPLNVTLSWRQSGQPLEGVVTNGTPSSAFIGTFANNWTGLTPDQSRMNPNPFKTYAGIGNGTVFNLPPVGGYNQGVGSAPTVPSIGGALWTVNCISVPGRPDIDHPCLHGQFGTYAILANLVGTNTFLAIDTNNGQLSYDHTFAVATLNSNIINLTGNINFTTTNFNLNSLIWNPGASQLSLGNCTVSSGVAQWDSSLSFGPCKNTKDGTGTAFGPAPDGVFFFGTGYGTTAFNAPNMAAGYEPPAYSANPAYTGTGSTHDRTYIFEAVLPSGAITQASFESAHVLTGATLNGSNFVTATCPSALQFGYPGGTTYKLLTVDNTVGGTRDLGTCALGGTIVDDGSVVTTGTILNENWSSDVGAFRHIVAPNGIIGAASDQTSSFSLNAGISSPASNTWAFGNGTVGDSTALIKAGSYTGPATAPSGSCSVIAWVFSQDGHATFCNGSTWVSKI